MILTDVDKVMSLLKAQSPLTVQALAKQLDTKSAKVESIVSFLEQAGHLKAVYHLTGIHVYLLPKTKDDHMITMQPANLKPQKQVSVNSLKQMRMLEEQLFTAGELLRLNQLGPDHDSIAAQEFRQPDLFARRSLLDDPRGLSLGKDSEQR